MKIIEWNINQRSNHGGVDNIPPWVAQQINELKADIVIITEFYKVSDWEEFVIDLASYNIFVTKNSNNEVLIAIKKEYTIVEDSEYSWGSNYDNNMPDYLDVSIKYKQKIITIVGARILVDKYKYNPREVTKEMKHRNEQNKKILDRIKNLQEKGNLIIGAGDFNTARRENSNEDWSMGVLEAELVPLDIKLYTPDGCSHQLDKGVFAGCPDHLFASNSMEVTMVPYYWNFVERDKNIYYEREYTKNIPNSYPDHGIVIAEIKEFN
ncbi:endonuclease/exonuclease/phosphatase family protein [Clostridium gasigenes]|uniref:endonuclease/exonuclease/phosphatase family protein n=1 Tax=Clostridium gasigenes TaxID=94869 RepID=UPI0014385D78|nr:endonuclease/exonuclease/phosphatase family protein [Clostridium gasigenes]NKF07117.1 endonuclease/exonuclease/phosphatase family protein [Clostridium gasigenes]QSW19632.1 endonuclease/exonuclease/phosphatase family protein [Clostridium gasigenes]